MTQRRMIEKRFSRAPDGRGAPLVRLRCACRAGDPPHAAGPTYLRFPRRKVPATASFRAADACGQRAISRAHLEEYETMKIERRYTRAGQSPYADIEFRAARSEIRNPDGSVVFSLDGIDVPGRLEPGRGRRAGAEIFPQGRRAGAAEERRGERRSRASCGARSPIRRRSPLCRRPSATAPRYRREQVFDRLAGAWTYWGWKGGYFDTEEDAARLP